MFPFLICFFGLAIKIRLFSELFLRFHLGKNIIVKLFLAVITFELFVIFRISSPLLVWSYETFTLTILMISPRVLEVYLERKLRELARPFLDQIILSIQTGTALKTAIQAAVGNLHGWKKHEVSKAAATSMMVGVTAQIRSPALANLFDELRWIDQSRTKTLEQLRSLRWNYKVREDFRRKSMQVSQQTRIQSVVVSILFLALLAFNIINFGIAEHLALTLTAALMFLSGLVFVFILGRSLKWKV